MEIITSHGNTDFDAFASMLLASKLYPDAKIVFPGAKERALSEFIENPYYNFEEAFLRDLDTDELERIILVDVSNSARIGPISRLLKKEGISIHVYDHHTKDKLDFNPDKKVIEPTGACSTILLREIRRKKITFTKMEATIFAMGIYEDTGFLTYETTTAEDVKMVAYLIENGADLALVSKFLKTDLNQPQIELFNELISNASEFNINGSRITISSASRDEYFHDAAAVVHKLVEVEGYPVFIATIRMGEKIHLIGRSRTSAVNIGKIFKFFGGGGHSPAAHATITGKTLVEVRERLVSLLKEHVKPALTARDLMTTDIITLAPEDSIESARDEMVKANINSIPVISENTVVGIVTRQQIDRALSHRLAVTLKDVMNRDFALVKPGSDIRIAEEFIMDGMHRSVLVGKSAENVQGIITRMDLFRRLYIDRIDESFSPAEFKSRRIRKLDLIEMMSKRFSNKVLTILSKASQIATERSERIFLVGGIVRDLILDFDNNDVDFVVIGDAIDFAEKLASRLGGYAHPHQQFGTSVIVLDDDFHVDVVTARRESYAYPGALPDVAKASLRADLYRRDFTINTLAIEITAENYGQIVDYFGGMKDIQNRTIRILHGLSFIDDPTRMLRAIRFASRMQFKLSEGTSQMLKSAVENNMLERVTGRRIQNELVQLLESNRPINALEMLDEYGILSSIHRKIRLDRFTMELMQKLGKTLSWFKLSYPDETISISTLYEMILMEKLTYNERKALCNRMHIGSEEKSNLLTYKRLVKKAVQFFNKKHKRRNSTIFNLFTEFSLEVLLYTHAFAHNDDLKQAIIKYLTDLRHIKLGITGQVIEITGLAPGPEYGKILRRVRNALLDGKVTHVKDQKAMAIKLANSKINS